MKSNAYAAKCHRCRRHVAPGAGVLDEKDAGGYWLVLCEDCADVRINTDFEERNYKPALRQPPTPTLESLFVTTHYGDTVEDEFIAALDATVPGEDARRAKVDAEADELFGPPGAPQPRLDEQANLFAERNAAARQVRQLKASVEDLERKLEAAQLEHVAQLAAEIRDHKQEIAGAERLADALRARVTVLEAERDALRASAEEARRERDAMGARLQKATALKPSLAEPERPASGDEEDDTAAVRRFKLLEID